MVQAPKPSAVTEDTVLTAGQLKSLIGKTVIKDFEWPADSDKFMYVSPARHPTNVLLSKPIIPPTNKSSVYVCSPFKGEIIETFVKEQWCRVLYEDGEKEDVDAIEALFLIKRAEDEAKGKSSLGKTAKNKATAAAASPSKKKQKKEKPRATSARDPRTKQQPAAGKSATPSLSKPQSKATSSAANRDRPALETPVVADPEPEAEDSEATHSLNADSERYKRLREEEGEEEESPQAFALLTNKNTTDAKKKKYKPKPKSSPGVSRSEAAEIKAHNDAVVKPVKENKRYIWKAKEEPWRKLKGFNVPVSLDPIMDAESIRDLKDCRERYYNEYRKAEESEAARVEQFVDAEGRVGYDPKTGKRLAKRPDRVTESIMKRDHLAIHQERRVGFVPGVDVNAKFYGRAELACLGVHRVPVAGIDCNGKEEALGIPGFAVSIVCSGWYEDDGDQGEELIFTGEGGNDLLGNRKQVADQTLERGNLALVGNIQLGLPVRVTRKNKDPNGMYGCVLIFDGLYDVVEYWKNKGKEGTFVYQFRLVRRPEQPALKSQSVQFGGISAPKKHSALFRNGLVDKDVSNGLEPTPISAVNETGNNQLTPYTSLTRVPLERELKANVQRGITQQALDALKQAKHQPSVEYASAYHLKAGVQWPADPTLPREYKDKPHEYIKKLNQGHLPYLESRNGKLIQLRKCKPVVYECGPWCNCPLGEACPLACTQQGIKYRLELFKTENSGWGVRSLDMIPQYTFVCNFFGDIYNVEEYDKLTDQGRNADYSLHLSLRPNDPKDSDNEDDDAVDADNDVDESEYVICGLERCNVGGIVNHSCDPNCFVQPILSHHHDKKMPRIAIFSARDIPPYTELTWDYGMNVDLLNAFNGGGGCMCGAECCVSKQQQQQQQQQ